MPTTTLLSDIKSRYVSLTKAEKKVADVVLADPQTVLNATITDLSQMCDVGETSVFRFCRSMRLAGYQDFKLSLALSANLQNTLEIDARTLPSKPEQMQDTGSQIYQITVNALQKSFASLDYVAIGKTVEHMHNAEILHFFGIGGSAITALEAQNKFLKISSNVVFTNDAHMQITTASLLGPGAVAVVFSNSGTTKAAISIAQLAKKSGACVIFVTQFLKTPAKKYSDIVLPCGAPEGPMQGGSIAAKMAQLYMVNILYAELFHLLGEKAVRNKTITASSVAAEML